MLSLHCALLTLAPALTLRLDQFDDHMLGFNAQQTSNYDKLLSHHELQGLDNFIIDPDHRTGASAGFPGDLQNVFDFQGLVDASGNGTINPAHTVGHSPHTIYRTHSESAVLQAPRAPVATPGLATNSGQHSVVHDPRDMPAIEGLYNLRHSRHHDGMPDHGSNATWDAMGNTNPFGFPADFSGGLPISDVSGQWTSLHSLAEASHGARNGHESGQPSFSGPGQHNMQPLPSTEVGQHSLDFLQGPDQQSSAEHTLAHRPHHMPRYGSDPIFNGTYTLVRTDYNNIVHAKENNLMNVPFADQVQAGNPARSLHQQARHMGQQGVSAYHANGMHGPPTTSATDKSNITSPTLSYHGGNVIGTPVQRFGSIGNVHDSARGFNMRNGREETEDFRAAKRRRSAIQVSDGSAYARGSQQVLKAEPPSDEDGPETPTASGPAKRQRSNTGRAVSSGSPHSPHVPSPAAVGSPKPRRPSTKPRQNLSEEQRRQNHIASEKKRREQIKTCFETLQGIVPVLARGRTQLSRADAIREITAHVRAVRSGDEMARRLFRHDEDNEQRSAYGSQTGGFDAAGRNIGFGYQQ